MAKYKGIVYLRNVGITSHIHRCHHSTAHSTSTAHIQRGHHIKIGPSHFRNDVKNINIKMINRLVSS